ARKARFMEAPRGLCLRVMDETRWKYYLLSGEARITDEKGATHQLTEADRHARELLPLDSGVERVDFPAGARLIRVDRNLFSALQNHGKAHGGIAIHLEVPISAEASALLRRISQDIAEDRFRLPRLPDTAMKARALLDDPEVSVEAVDALVREDVALTATVIRAANSALFTGMHEVSTIREAVVRMGLTRMKKIVLVVFLDEVFTVGCPRFGRFVHQLRSESRVIAALAHAMAARVGLEDPENALLVGMLSQIGKFGAATYIAERREDLEDVQAFALIEAVYPFVGEMIASQWRFGPEVTTAIRHASNQSGLDPDHPEADIVNVATRYMQAFYRGDAEVQPRYDETLSFHALDLPEPDAAGRLPFLDQVIRRFEAHPASA
ncbi:MAG: HDOD domain-containing protein, partial [Ectothiorhodospira sp.]